MQTQTKIFIGVILLVLIVIGFSLNNNSLPETVVSTGETQVATEEEEMETHSATETNVEMGEAVEEADMMEAPEAPLAAGIYTEYSPEAVANSQADHIILSFSATWCPSCRTLDKNINENVTAIPDDVEIYKVDYDTYTDLKKKYGVTTQHTQVVVNSDGTMIKKWTGGSTLDGVLAQL